MDGPPVRIDGEVEIAAGRGAFHPWVGHLKQHH